MSSNTFLPPSPVIPMSLVVTNITNTNPMVVTVSPTAYQTNTYIAGQVVKLTVPPPYGMIQADQLSGQILFVNGNDLSVQINALQFNNFVTPTTYQQQPASIAPAGSNNIYNYTVVPFHSEGNIGN